MIMEDEIKYILSVVSSEKATRLLQEQNKLSIIVRNDANKIEIKKELESLFSVKVDSINIINRMDGKKEAIVKLKKDFVAADIATKLGVV